MGQDANALHSDPIAAHPRGRMIETRAAQIHQLYAQARTGLIGAFLGAAVLAAALWRVVTHEWLLVWLAATVVVHVPRHMLIKAYFRAEPEAADIERWGRRFALGVIAGAALWGAAAVAFFSSQSLLHQFLLSLFLAGVSCGAAAVYWPLRQVYVPAILLELLPLSGRFMYEGNEVHIIIGLVIFMFAVVLVAMGNSANAGFVEILQLRFEKADLADSLETARQELKRRVHERTAALVQANEDLRGEIFERKAAEAALRESEKKYRALVQTSVEGICVIQDGLLRFVNLKTAHFLGFTEQEIIGSEYTRFIHPDDRAAAEARYVAQLEDKKLHRRFTFRVVSRQGDIKWLEGDTTLCQWDGRPAVLLFAADVTDRKQAEEAFRQANERFRVVFDTAADSIFIKDRDLRYVLVNPAMERLFGMSAVDLLGKTDADLFGEDAAVHIVQTDRLVLGGRVFSEEHEKPVRGVPKVFNVVKVPMRNESGEIIGLCGIARDVTERKQAEEALREREATLKSVLRAAHMGIGVVKGRRTIAWSNEALCRMTGYSAEELVGQSALLLYENEDEYERVGRLKYSQIEARGWGAIETRWKRKDGEIIEVFLSSAAIEPGNLAAGVVFTALDITDRKQAERALRDSEEKYRFLVDHAPIGILSVDTGGWILEANRKLVEILGSPNADATKEINMFTFPLLVEAGISDAFQRCITEDRPVAAERPYVSKWGKRVHLRILLTPLRDSRGTLRGCQAVMEDVSDQKRAEAELIASEEKSRIIIDSSPVGIGIVVDAHYVYVNPAFIRMFGYESADEMIGSRVGSFAVPEDADRVRQSAEASASGESGEIQFQARNVKKDRTHFDAEGWITRIQFGGNPAVLIFVSDVTEAKSLRTQLLHAQKMEAVGTLAGGIAHDFNNLLSVVLGYSELLLANKAVDDPEYDDLVRIAGAARNGADLVQRILTFSRKVETQPRPLNLNHTVKQAEHLLRRTIPRIIELELVLRPDLKMVNADPGQIEQVVLNLALNAKDAMPEGGRLVIETDNIALGEEFRKSHLGGEPGNYVMMKVSDTGVGIEECVREHIFEPFYTTKGVGQGSGLGLAMVYGIVTGHGGYVECYSNPGAGTTFVIYLPTLQVEQAPVIVTVESEPAGGSEVILVVDDEEFIRELGRRILTRAGYEVLVAANGREAVEIYRKRQKEVDLVILDLIMPIMEGTQCLGHLLEINPAVKVLVATGYWPTGTARSGLEAKTKGFVSKPFDIGQLLKAVREALDKT